MLCPVVNFTQRYRTCVVVGAAPHLAYVEVGSAIDAHEAVFRLNAHAMHPNLGNKTTFRVANNAFQLDTHRRSSASKNIVPTMKHARVGDKIYCVRQAQYQSFASTVGIRPSTILSTGALAVHLALSTCDSVALYGFGLQSYDHVIRDSRHDWAAEGQWIRHLDKRHAIRHHSAKRYLSSRCKSLKYVRGALDVLHSQTFVHLTREDAMPVEHLLSQAASLLSDGCESVFF